jgi:Ca2+-binding RTX toxin-like protein
MATFSFTADASTNTASTPVQALVLGDVVFVGREATLTALGATSEAFSGVSDHQMTINGELFAADDDAVFTTGGNNDVMVGSDAFISAEGAAFDFDAGANEITNAGILQSEGRAIDIGGGSNDITNTGHISSLQNTGVLMSGGFNDIFNAGTIAGLSGIVCVGGFNRIHNSGTVTADGTAISVGGVAGETNFVVNNGIVQGLTAFSGGDANDTLINNGRLFGTVSLGDGDDLFDGREGVASGTIFGDAGDDTLLGGNSNETFEGGTGADFISGGGGFDVVSFINGLAVRASLSDQSQNTGEALGDEYESIEGLIGSIFNDSLTGNSAANTLDGRGGNDTLTGLGGNDRYNVNVATDRVIEAAAGGTDTVFATSSFALSTNGANVENLRLQGAGNNFAKGTSLANNLYGNSGNNVIDGLGGNDALVGRDGDDTFRFTTTLNAATNVDRILDFIVADDTIAVDNAKFTGLAAGNLLAGNFFIGAAAHDGNDRIIYNDATGALLFDRDGTGAIAAIQFARLDPGLALTNADFVVI